jgi:hypothetical protein
MTEGKSLMGVGTDSWPSEDGICSSRRDIVISLYRPAEFVGVY